MESNDVIFQHHPVVAICGNRFYCPTIIQWEDTPLMEVGKFEPAGYTTKFAIYNSDGAQIAVVKGCQVYPTKAGKDAAIKPRYEPNLTVCEVDGKTIFELRRTGPTAL